MLNANRLINNLPIQFNVNLKTYYNCFIHCDFLCTINICSSSYELSRARLLLRQINSKFDTEVKRLVARQ